MEGDGEFNYAYYALHELKIRVKDFAEMDIYERAATIAMIDIRVKKESRERAKRK